MAYLISACMALAVVNFLVQAWQNEGINYWQHDEHYHIKYTVFFYQGKWEYDEHITTPPGLYLLGVAYLNFIGFINTYIPMGDLNLQDYIHIRYMNSILLGVANFALLIKILTHKTSAAGTLTLKPEINHKIYLYALCLIMMPWYYPMHFVFYTEIGSFFYLFLIYYLVICKHFNQKWYGQICLVLLGICSFMQRQTNIIWINYIYIIYYIENQNLLSIKMLFKQLWMVILDLMFIGFYIHNGYSIVIGDRESHPPVVHYSQFLYLQPFLVILLPVPIYTKVFGLFKLIVRILDVRRPINLIVFIVLNVIAYYMIVKGTFTHRFITGNTGHYSHFWNREIITKDIRFKLGPIYVLSLMLVYDLLWKCNKDNTKWKYAIFVVSSLMTLLPCQLFELRYFLHSIMFLALELFKSSYRDLYIWALLLIYLNFTILHNYRDHYWYEDHGGRWIKVHQFL